jgi:hypothetical protein
MDIMQISPFIKGEVRRKPFSFIQPLIKGDMWIRILYYMAPKSKGG